MHRTPEDGFVDPEPDDDRGTGHRVLRAAFLAGNDRVSKVPDFVESFDLARRLTEAIWVYDIDRCRVVLANDEALRLWQASSEEELADRDLSIDMSPTVARRLKQYQAGFDKSDATFSELWTLYPNGEPISLDVIYTGYRLPDGRTGMLCETKAIADDTSQTLRSAEALLHTDVRIALFAVSGPDLYMNPAARNTWPFEDFRLQSVFLELTDFDEILHDLERHGETRKVRQVKTAAGIAWHDMSFKSCSDAATGAPATLVTSIDVSELKKARDRASYLANRDQLTGCYNRASFQKRLEDLDVSGHPESLALLYLDLDRFKQINDRYGHEAGDDLLRITVDRINRQLDDTDLLFRIGGDEFIVLLPLLEGEAEFADRIDRIRAEVARPFLYKNVKIDISTSIGAAVRQGGDLRSEDLVRHADIALYEAKRLGRNRHAVYSDEMGQAASERLTIETDLQDALARDEFRLHLQPRVDLRTGRVVSAEALVRWYHPERGILMPDDFIDICEETGLLEALGSFVLHQASVLVRDWNDQGLDIGISVNVSPRQFLNATFIENLERIAAEPGFRRETIELEIIESIIAGDQDLVARRLQRITELGYLISVDDFGTGYSNLAYITRFPINCIKIDKSFVDTMPSSGPIISLIQTMATQIGACTVAEGVETADQLHSVKEIGCRHVQGFYFSEAVPAEEFLGSISKLPTL